MALGRRRAHVQFHPPLHVVKDHLLVVSWGTKKAECGSELLHPGLFPCTFPTIVFVRVSGTHPRRRPWCCCCQRPGRRCWSGVLPSASPAWTARGWLFPFATGARGDRLPLQTPRTCTGSSSVSGPVSNIRLYQMIRPVLISNTNALLLIQDILTVMPNKSGIHIRWGD